MATLSKKHDVSQFHGDGAFSMTLYDGDRNLVVSTDGAAIITVPADGSPSASCPLDPKKLAKINGKPKDVESCKGKEPERKPDWAKLFADRSVPKHFVGLDPELLRRLAEHAENSNAHCVYLGFTGGKTIVDSAMSFFYATDSKKEQTAKEAKESTLVSGFVMPMIVNDKDVHEHRVSLAFNPDRNAKRKPKAEPEPVKMVKKPKTDVPVPSSKTPATKKPKAAGGGSKELKRVNSLLREASIHHSMKSKKEMARCLDEAAKIATTPEAKELVAKRRKLLK